MDQLYARLLMELHNFSQFCTKIDFHIGFKNCFTIFFMMKAHQRTKHQCPLSLIHPGTYLKLRRMHTLTHIHTLTSPFSLLFPPSEQKHTCAHTHSLAPNLSCMITRTHASHRSHLSGRVIE